MIKHNLFSSLPTKFYIAVYDVLVLKVKENFLESLKVI